MSLFRTILVVIAAIACAKSHGDDLTERIDDRLTYSGFNDQARLRISGLLDMEYYHFSDAAPGLIFTDDSELWNPRLSVFCDGQFGSSIYVFAQARADRGFDPSDQSADLRLDEYALRWTPWDDGRFSMQLGRFATVVGNAVQRHLSWENPFINAPLIYENVTAIHDAGPPPYAESFGSGPIEEKYEYNPVIWGPSYATGVSLACAIDKFDCAVEVKNASLSSRPESWDLSAQDFDYPTVSGRVGYRPDMAWNFGFSASDGPYFTDQARAFLPPGTGLGDYRQTVIGQDISYAWGHWQLWFELFEARFDVPRVGNADTLGYYVEAKYKFTPRLFGALRWNQQFFGDVPDGGGNSRPWGNDISRLDAAVTFRFTPSSQMKLQYDIQHEDRAYDSISHLAAAQFTFRF